MTRLREEDIHSIAGSLKDYDASLVRKTGHTLKQIAMRAASISEEEMGSALVSCTIAVFPITWGQGVLKGFAETVGNILSHLGANVLQTTQTDLGGLAEAVEKRATLLFCADDDRFVALNLPLKKVVDNAEATAKGYVEALELMAGGLDGRKVLVIGGAGHLGWKAVTLLEEKGAKVSAFDINQGKLGSFAKSHPIVVERNIEESLRQYSILFDASPAADIIRAEHIRPETLVAAPGIPLGLTKEAYDLVKDRLIHDPLQIGIATMLAEAITYPREGIARYMPGWSARLPHED
jgi:pyrrolysine biosynthesis protein PylD